MVYPFLKKGSTNAPHHKGKTFQEIQYFDHIHISQFLLQNKAILHFLDTLYHPNSLFIILVYPFMKRDSYLHAPHQNSKTFQETLNNLVPPKNVGPQKIFGPQKVFRPEKFLVPKKFWSQKNFCSQKYFCSQKNFWY